MNRFQISYLVEPEAASVICDVTVAANKDLINFTCVAHNGI